MSKTTKVFQKVPVRIQNRSGFDMSHYNLGTLTTGTLTPVLVEPLAPGDRVSLGELAQLDLPPLASTFYGRVDFDMQAFFVPYRILLQQWKKFATFENNGPLGGASQSKVVFKNLPKLRVPFAQCGPGSLADYFGMKVYPGTEQSDGNIDIPNPLPFIAYHMIYDKWYRDKQIQKPVFEEEFTAADTSNANRLRRIPYVSMLQTFTTDEDLDPLTREASTSDVGVIQGNVSGSTLASNSKLNDGVSIWDLRQRNWHKDYLTNSTPKPQAGDPVLFKFDVSASGTADEEGNVSATGVSGFTIAGLRAANSLTKFIERNNLAGPDYADQIEANFGVRPSDAAINYPIYLGQASHNVYTRSIFQTAVGVGTTVAAGETNNPFKTQGAEYGKASSMGKDSLIDDFMTTEYGFLFVIGSLVPHAFYASGIRRYLFDSVFSDFPNPQLASVGDQPVYKGEVSLNLAGVPFTSYWYETFGYQGRYSHVKYHDDEVHGLLRDGSTLQNFAIQRTIVNPELGSSFIQIPKTALDQVLAATTGVSGFSAWYQIFFDFKKSSLLPVYSVPTLGDEPDQHTEIIDRGNRRF